MGGEPIEFTRDADGAWWAAHDALELRVRGDAAPDADAIARAHAALTHLEVLRADAVRHLAAFLDRARFDDGWDVSELHVGVGAASGAGELALGLVHARDTYGAWFVTFRVLEAHEAASLTRWAWPVALTRRDV